MYANLPKFGRVRDRKSHQDVEGRSYIKQGEKENRDAYLQMKQGVSLDMKRGSYADVILGINYEQNRGIQQTRKATGHNHRCTWISL